MCRINIIRRIICLCALATLAAPAFADPPPWRRAITEPDRKRLADLWKAWTKARTQVVDAGKGALWDGQGVLTQVGATTVDPPPPIGRYHCRTLKLGTRTPGMPVFSAGDSTPCRIEAAGDNLRFVREEGGQRSAGVLYADGQRLIYLGALSLGSEGSLFKYNTDTERNQVGVLRSLGPQRWRIELPFPKWESTLDLIEIVPAAP